MNNLTLAHVTSEIVIIGGIALYFSKKHKKAEQSIRDLEDRISKLEHHLHASNKHIKNLYNIIDTLSLAGEKTSGERPISSYVSKNEPRSQIRQRRGMKVVNLPLDPEDDLSFDEEPPRAEKQPPRPSKPAAPAGVGFPLEAIFGMMGSLSGGGNPLEGFMSVGQPPSAPFSSGSDTNVSVQIEEDNDDDDIQQELQNLLHTSPSSSSSVHSLDEQKEELI